MNLSRQATGKQAISGQCMPLMMDDIDTDIIIPAQYLTQTSRRGYGEHAFARLKQADPDFVLNQARYAPANILITGENFGCGSSREHAVWAIMELGIEAIIAPSFADIFANNAQKNGLVLITTDTDTVKAMAQQAQDQLRAHIDLQAATVTTDDHQFAFNINLFFQYTLTHGLNELDYLMQHQSAIVAHQAAQKGRTLFIQETGLIS